jgi:hypothetical protein
MNYLEESGTVQVFRPTVGICVAICWTAMCWELVALILATCKSWDKWFIFGVVPIFLMGAATFVPSFTVKFVTGSHLVYHRAWPLQSWSVKSDEVKEIRRIESEGGHQFKFLLNNGVELIDPDTYVYSQVVETVSREWVAERKIPEIDCSAAG